MCNSRPSFAASPVEVPARSRRPDTKIASGASVIGSTTRSPRTPCALRTRPTIISSGGVTSIRLLGGFLGRRRRGGLARLRQRHCGRGQPPRQHSLVTAFEHPRFAQQRANGVGRLRAVVEPIIGAIRSQVERLLTLTRSVLANHLDELAVARAARIGNHDPEQRLLFAARAPETNANCHVTPR